MEGVILIARKISLILVGIIGIVGLAFCFIGGTSNLAEYQAKNAQLQEKVRQERTAEQARIEAAKKEKQAEKEKAAAEERKHTMKAVHNQ